MDTPRDDYPPLDLACVGCGRPVTIKDGYTCVNCPYVFCLDCAKIHIGRRECSEQSTGRPR